MHFSDAPFHYEGHTDNSPIGFSSYLLEFNTCNVPFDSISFIPNYKEDYLAGSIDCVDNPPFYALSNVGEYKIVEESLCDKPNENIERHLNKTFREGSNTRAWYNDEDFNFPLDYRITPVAGIDVTASADLCGVKAGRSINDLLLIFGYYASPDYDFNLCFRAGKSDRGRQSSASKGHHQGSPQDRYKER